MRDVQSIVDGLDSVALAVLRELGSADDFGYRGFAHLMRACGADRAEIKAAIGALLLNDLVVFARGLMTEDGEVAGSGYARSDDGDRLVAVVEAFEQAAEVVAFRLQRQESAT